MHFAQISIVPSLTPIAMNPSVYAHDSAAHHARYSFTRSNMTSSPYPLPYAMHDLGTWPVADLQWDKQENMPLEETANMLIMAAAIGARTNWDVAFLSPYWATIRTWGEYLLSGSGLPYPSMQLTTDDFAGAQVNSSGLALKGAIGVAAYGLILHAVGDAVGAEAAWEAAGYFAEIWTRNGWFADPLSPDGEGPAAHATREYLFNEPGASSWSMPYNAVWIRILRLDGLLGDRQSHYLNQSAAWLYDNQRHAMGIPLLAGSPGVKTDWSAWIAALSYSEGSSSSSSSSLVGDSGSVKVGSSTPPLPSAISAFIFKSIMAAAAARPPTTEQQQQQQQQQQLSDDAAAAAPPYFPPQWRLPFADYYSADNGTEWFTGRAVVGAAAAPVLVVQAASTPSPSTSGGRPNELPWPALNFSHGDAMRRAFRRGWGLQKGAR